MVAIPRRVLVAQQSKGGELSDETARKEAGVGGMQQTAAV